MAEMGDEGAADRPLARGLDHENRGPDGSSRPSRCHPADRRQRRPRRRRADCRRRANATPARRQGPRCRPAMPQPATSRKHTVHPRPYQPQAAASLRQKTLLRRLENVGGLLSAQKLPPCRHTLRQVGPKLPRRRLPRRYRVLLVMSSEPS